MWAGGATSNYALWPFRSAFTVLLLAASLGNGLRWHLAKKLFAFAIHDPPPQAPPPQPLLLVQFSLLYFIYFIYSLATFSLHSFGFCLRLSCFWFGFLFGCLCPLFWGFFFTLLLFCFLFFWELVFPSASLFQPGFSCFVAAFVYTRINFCLDFLVRMKMWPK